MTKDERIQELEDEVMVLKDALGLTFKGDPAWGLRQVETEILGVIAKTAVATNDRIRTAVWGMKSDPPSDGLLKVHIWKMRPKLAKHGIFIETKWGVGYFLSPESRALVKAAA